MKKDYISPSMEVVGIKAGQQLLAGSKVTNVDGNGNLNYNGGGNGTGSSTPHAPMFDDEDWDDEDEDWDDEDISLESLSENFFISSSYLSMEFKQVTGFNLSNYIQLTRIKNAQYRLVSSNDKISIIAQECGFSSFSQFNRVFNKIAGTSPREYRQTATIGK